MRRLHGQAAIARARNVGVLLSKYADPIDVGRDNLSVEEAEAIAMIDPGLIYLKIKTPASYHAKTSHGTDIIHVIADDLGQAVKMLTKELDREGRRQYYESWQRGGFRVQIIPLDDEGEQFVEVPLKPHMKVFTEGDPNAKD